ncbi:hypothetical protein ACU635_39675 [[Actinomadura] parvosata]|uniref:hypothetical protein n=1 Tax=[Actinomadura] parvosata TaxID=1955412 RepID=UPI00406C0BD7
MLTTAFGSRLIGGQGDDRLVGGSGDDELTGETGADVMRGGPGTDHCTSDPMLSTGTSPADTFVGCETTSILRPCPSRSLPPGGPHPGDRRPGGRPDGAGCRPPARRVRRGSSPQAVACLACMGGKPATNVRASWRDVCEHPGGMFLPASPLPR